MSPIILLDSLGSCHLRSMTSCYLAIDVGPHLLLHVLSRTPFLGRGTWSIPIEALPASHSFPDMHIFNPEQFIPRGNSEILGENLDLNMFTSSD